jgi:hypothetical protein
MFRNVVCVTVLAAAVAFAAACSKSSGTTQPTGTPSTSAPTVSISAFSGNWTTAATTPAPSSCTQQDYTITPTGTNSASVVYAIACGGYKVEGTGSGSLSGSTLTWNAKGSLSGPNLPCPTGFEFKNSTATLQADNQVLVTYNAVVCGLTFNGSQLLKRK